MQVDLGYGITIAKARLNILRANRPTQLARQMMHLLFSRHEMATGSVTGQASKGKPAKPALDANKVDALLSEYTDLVIVNF